MSEAQSALNGARYDGYAVVTEAGLCGMVTLRGDLASKGIQKAVKSLTGAEVPGERGIATSGKYSVCWMSPDELLILMPHGDAQAACDQLPGSLKGVHHLVANVSDARAMFTVKGPACREVLAKLAPVDTSRTAFKQGQLRRSRLAQAPAAMWMSDDQTANVICFRSVAAYVFGILSAAAMPGSEVLKGEAL